MTADSPAIPEHATLSVINDPRAIDEAQARVVAALERFNYPKASVFAVRLSLHEAMSNAFSHGHRGLPNTTPVALDFRVEENRVVMAITDQGPGFRPDEVPDPTLDENIERGSGRGLLLIRAYMSSARYNARGNRLEMVYERPSTP